MQEEIWESIDDFKISNICLGEGQSCKVFYGYNVKNGQKAAVKKINLKTITNRLGKQLGN